MGAPQIKGGGPATVTVSTRLRHSTIERLEKEAKRLRLTRSQTLRLIIAKSLDQLQQKEHESAT